MNVQSFTPGGTKTMSATATSSSVTFTGGDINTSQVMITNSGPNTVFIRFSVGASTALTTDMPILSGAIAIFNKGLADTISGVCASTQTATVYCTAGEGQ